MHEENPNPNQIGKENLYVILREKGFPKIYLEISFLTKTLPNILVATSPKICIKT